ncbi:MAG: lytic transglycosylase domain-containing protein [Bauldia sp.]|uniref:lytic transglycosylase domain-containing protein n=1 Tax=Bauldia sp. TaxID=2575872 RepID=UPI001E141067|nr:lytic transglycosylase domain-containing protein [Bauldia sp.]MCB1495676.1 lytic transglycosylase domain-containing protein [Bauldia sp.]
MPRPAPAAILVALLLPLPVHAEEEAAPALDLAMPAKVLANRDAPVEKPAADDPKTICSLIEDAAAAHRLPVGFFTRLIWKESRFRPDALSPKGAQGIAQFMPGTAALRELADPFDPIEAIPASAHYLRDLTDQFGNLGLAAAAYNSGERRVETWLAGSGGLPFETRSYVLSITGWTADEWNSEAAAGFTRTTEGRKEDCLELAARLAKPGAGSQLVAEYKKADWAPWGVQVAGNFSLNRAMAAYSRQQARYASVLGGQTPMVVRGVNRSMGNAPVFQIRVPAQTRQEASDICRRLKAAGGACLVLKTGR